MLDVIMSAKTPESTRRNIERKNVSTSSIPKAGTLSQLFEHLSVGDNVSLQCTLVDAFLHTYRIFATTEQVLLAADRKFWDLCYSKTVSPEEKLKKIHSLRLIMSRWLRQPHVRDFDSPTGLAELHRFTCIVVSWYRVFQPGTNNDTSGNAQHPADWTSRYVDKSSTTKSGTFSRLMFSGTDQRSLERMAFKLEYLCKHAEYRAKTLQSKYAGSDSSAHLGRQIYRLYAPPSTSPISPLPQNERSRKLSAPPETRLEAFIGLEALNVAEELTVIDQRLFMNLLLPELLENVRGRPSPTYTATVDQFNRVVNAVQCSVLRIGPDAPKDSTKFRGRQPRDTNAPFAVAVWSNRHFSSQDKSLTSDNAMETFCEAEHKRASILAQWIDIAWRLRQLNNLNSLQAVLAALQIGVIRRLRHSWTIVELLHAEHYRRFEALAAFMDISENHERLREHMRKHLDQLMKTERNRRQHDDNASDQPAREIGGMIPYLGIFMSDLTFLNSAQPDYLTASPSLSGTPDSERMTRRLRGRSPVGSDSRGINQTTADSPNLDRSDWVPRVTARSHSRPRDNTSQQGEKLINFAKHVREANTLRDLYLLQYSASFYHLKSDPKFQVWFDQFPKLTEQEALKYSLMIEPKEAQSTVTAVVSSHDRRATNKSMSDIHTWSSPRLFNSVSSQRGDTRRARSGSRGLFPRPQPRASVLTNPYFAASSNSLAPSSIDSPYHSSSDVDSPPSSPPASSVFSHVFRPHADSKKSSPQLLEVPQTSYENIRSQTGPSHPNLGSADVFARVTMQNAETSPSSQGRRSTITPSSAAAAAANATAAATENTITTTITNNSNNNNLNPPSEFLRQIAKLGSTPNLAAMRKASPTTGDNHSIFERVLSTDKIADLLVRVLVKFRLPLHNISQFDLIQVREGMPDRVCPLNSHAITALSGTPVISSFTDKLNKIARPQVFECVLVQQIRKSSTLANNFRCQNLLDRTTNSRKFSHYGTLSRIHRARLSITDMWSPKAPKLTS